jgi:hypothetical protein
VPQFVKVIEDDGFDTALTTMGLAASKADVVSAAKEVVDSVLGTANVRVCWQAGGLREQTDPRGGFYATSIELGRIRPSEGSVSYRAVRRGRSNRLTISARMGA